jgi:hypothetical protein
MKRSEMTCAKCINSERFAPSPETDCTVACALKPTRVLKHKTSWCAQGAWKGIGKHVYSGEAVEMVIFWTDIGVIEEEPNK